MAVKTRAAKAGFQTARRMPGKRATARGAARAGRRSAKLGVRSARRNPSLQALLHDDRVHDRLLRAAAASQALYGRAAGSNKRAEELVDDRRTRKELKRAIGSLREAGSTVASAKTRRRRRFGLGGLFAVLAAAGLAAIALNEQLRDKLLGAVGQGDEKPATSPNGAAATTGQPGSAYDAPPVDRIT